MSLRLVFGPVPSRRLGRSLGVNNIPPKHCTYSCVYCQVGRTPRLEVERRQFYDWRGVVSEVVKAVRRVGAENIDYVTFVPDGEPTLDINLGREIRGVKEETGLSVAVLTNGSLLHREDVRDDLYWADTVSIKVDAAAEDTYRKTNRPHPTLRLDVVIEGLQEFAAAYNGRVITETMLVRGLNDSEHEMEGIARLVAELKPATAYVAVPVRPPAEKWVEPPSEEVLVTAYMVFERYLPGRVRLLASCEEGEFGRLTGDPVRDILLVTAVHPMRIDHARRLLEKGGLDPDEALAKLKREGKIVVVEYGGQRFIVRKHRAQ